MDNINALYYACNRGNVEIVSLLLDKVDLEVQDYNASMRPIHHACKKGYIEIVKLLLDKVDFEAKNKYEITPIHYTCHHNS